MDTNDDELPGMLALAKGVQSETWPHTMDAQVWAKLWLETVADKPEIATDEGAMIGWFANAIMAGYDFANATMAGTTEQRNMNTKDLQDVFAATSEATRIERERCVECVPTNWCDSLLTGPDAAMPSPGTKITHRHVEALLRGIQDRIRDA